MQLTACSAGDLNRDARPDLACVEERYGGGALFLLRGNGNGTFGQPAPIQPTPHTSGAS
jgi:hypothetical protein